MFCHQVWRSEQSEPCSKATYLGTVRSPPLFSFRWSTKLFTGFEAGMRLPSITLLVLCSVWKVKGTGSVNFCGFIDQAIPAVDCFSAVSRLQVVCFLFGLLVANGALARKAAGLWLVEREKGAG